MPPRGPAESIPPEALLAAISPPLATIAERLRAIVRDAVPDATERVRAGWGLIGYDLRVGRRSTFFAWIWPEPEHVHLGFVNGVLMDDPSGLLAGAGITKKARWLTYEAGATIDGRPANRLVLEAARIAGLSREELLARRMELEERGVR